MQNDTAILALCYGLLLGALIAMAATCGCASAPSAHYPVDRLLCPVTEEVPHVIID